MCTSPNQINTDFDHRLLREKIFFRRIACPQNFNDFVVFVGRKEREEHRPDVKRLGVAKRCIPMDTFDVESGTFVKKVLNTGDGLTAHGYMEGRKFERGSSMK